MLWMQSNPQHAERGGLDHVLPRAWIHPGGHCLLYRTGFFNRLYSVSHPADAALACPVFNLPYGVITAAAIAINLLMLTLAYVPAAILFPIEAGGILIVSAFLSRGILKEPIGKLRLFSILIAAVSLVLTNL
ncbi:MAG: hypothetical protein IKN04_19755 [Clostridia bacterium]|nr:hypothetical protein [Clostridia bacterium]